MPHGRQSLGRIPDIPGSTRALALEAGLSPALLCRIADGTRSLTPTVALQLAKALERWRDRADASAKTLRRVAGTARRRRETRLARSASDRALMQQRRHRRSR